MQTDLNQRDETTYGALGFRTFKVGINFVAAVKINRKLGFDIGYAQKLSGAYFRATRALSISVNQAF